MMLRRFSWVFLWIVVLAASAWLGWRADRQYVGFMEGGYSSAISSAKLIPDDVTFFAYDPNFRQGWKDLRSSRFFASLIKTAPLRDLAESLKWNATELSSYEQWVLRFWGPGAIVGYSKEEQSLWILSPIGKRGACAQWLVEMALSPIRSRANWKVQHIDGHWCFESRNETWLPGMHLQFSVVSGVAVLAIGTGQNPIHGVLEMRDDAKRSVLAQHQALIEQAFANSTQISGFIRFSDPKAPVTEWNFGPDGHGATSLNGTFPLPVITTESSAVQGSQLLQGLRQPDDLISTIFSWDDLRGLWNECSPLLPEIWREPIQQVNLDALLGNFKSKWDPIFEKMGHEVFVGLGDSEVLSEKYQIPFPRTVIALPFSQPELFVNALESTVLECNQRLNADLLIRKVSRAYGEYYEVRMGESDWKRQHQLKELPVFAFSKGLLVIAPNTADMEKTLSHFFEKSDPTSVLPIQGIQIRMNMRGSPNTIRILLAALGAFNPQGENIFLSSQTLGVLSEIFGLMENFGDSDISVTHKPGSLSIRALLAP